jgi:hypothetical protein
MIRKDDMNKKALRIFLWVCYGLLFALAILTIFLLKGI